MSIEQLEQWLTQSPTDIDQWLEQGLKTGCQLLNLETGIVSHIKDDTYTIRQTFSTLGEIFQPGDQFELKNTYCEAVVRRNKTVTYIQVGAIPEMRLHPVYVAVQLESYVGSPLYEINKEVCGTLNFSSHTARQTHFSDEETQLVERMAKRIDDVLSGQAVAGSG